MLPATRTRRERLRLLILPGYNVLGLSRNVYSLDCTAMQRPQTSLFTQKTRDGKEKASSRESEAPKLEAVDRV